MQTQPQYAAEAVGAQAHLDDDALISAANARALAGGISAMSEWRWRRDGLLPTPITIRRRCYYRRGEFMRALRNLGTPEAE